MELSNLLLLSGNDIPFIEANLTIHTPTIKEIGFIGEDDFYIGCQMLNFDKQKFLTKQDNVNLESYSNFNILMSVLHDEQSIEIQKAKNSVTMLLSLLFPNMTIHFTDVIELHSEDNSVFIISEKNFEEFKNILISLFCLKPLEKEGYNPKGSLARRIAEKLEKGRQKIAQQKGDGNKKISILSNYVSVLSVGEHKDMNSLLNYSVYQLYDEFERFILKSQFDMNMSAALAGAKMNEEPKNWMQDIHCKEYEDSKER